MAGEVSRYGPWAVVTGGSEGVGSAIAHRLAADGVSLVLVARRPEPLAETASSVRALGVEVVEVALDLLAPNAAQQLLDATADREVGLLVLNAGANTYGHDFVTGELGRVREVLDLNVTRTLELLHAFGGPMRQRGRGGLLVIGSLAGYLGQPELATYSAAKAFTRVFCEGLWEELSPYDVHVLHLVLGVTRTPAMERAGLRFDLPGLVVAEPDEVARVALEQLPHGPVHVMPGNERLVEIRSGIDRAKLVRSAVAGHQRLAGGS